MRYRRNVNRPRFNISQQRQQRNFVPVFIQASKWKRRILALLKELIGEYTISTMDKITYVDPTNPRNTEYTMTLDIEVFRKVDRRYFRVFVHHFIEHTGSQQSPRLTYISIQDPENPAQYMIRWNKVIKPNGLVVFETETFKLTKPEKHAIEETEDEQETEE